MMSEPVIKVVEVGADGKTVDKSGAPVAKVRATDTLTPEQIQEVIIKTQKKLRASHAT